MNMKNAIGTIVGIGVVILLRFFVFSADIESELKSVCKDLNKKCPQMVDDVTRFDKTEAGPGKKITYYYTLINVPEENLTAETLKGLEDQVRANVLVNADLKAFRDENVDMRYVYRNEAEKVILDFTIDH